MKNRHDCCLGSCWLDQGSILSLMWLYYRYLKYEQRITVSSDRWPGYVENLPVIIVSKFSTLISHLLYVFYSSSLFCALKLCTPQLKTVKSGRFVIYIARKNCLLKRYGKCSKYGGVTFLTIGQLFSRQIFWRKGKIGILRKPTERYW